MDKSTYFVTGLAGPKVAGQRVAKGGKLELTEPQARAELLAGTITADESRIDDPFGEAAQATADKAAAVKTTAKPPAPAAAQPQS